MRDEPRCTPEEGRLIDVGRPLRFPIVSKSVIVSLVVLAIVVMAWPWYASRRSTKTTARYEYDSSGRLTRTTAANGDKTEYAYDKQGLLTRIRTPDNNVRYAYDVQGNRTEMRDKTSSTKYKYDAFNRLVQVTTKRSPEMTLRYEYDPWGRVIRIVVVGGGTTGYDVRYVYDLSGNITSVDDGRNRVTYSYFPDRGEMVRLLPNGIRTIYSYSPLGQIIGLRHLGPDSTLITAYRYEYDPEGRITLLSEQTPRRTQTARYEWTSGGQLTALYMPDGEVIRFSYDAMGNRLTANTGKLATKYEYDDLGRLTKAGETAYEWDQAGNLTGRQGPGDSMTFGYDSRNLPMLVQLPKHRIELGWDGDGSLVSRRNGGTTSHFLSNPLAPQGSLLAEYDDAGKVGSAYLYGNTLIGKRDSNGVDRFFLEDGLGQVRQTADVRGRIVDSQGRVAWPLLYASLVTDGLGITDIWTDPTPAADVKDLEARAMQNTVKELGGTVTGLEFALLENTTWYGATLSQYGTVQTLVRYANALRLMRSRGPDALRGTPADHLVLAWDLLKGPQHLPFRSTITPIARLYDDGALRRQTWGVQTTDEYYSSTAPDWPGLRKYGYDPLTDTISRTVHTVIRTTETFDGGQFNSMYQNPQGSPVGARSKSEWEEALRDVFIELIPLPVEEKRKKRDDSGGDPPDPPNGGGGGAAVNPFETPGPYLDPFGSPDPDDTVGDRANDLTKILGDPDGGMQGPPYLDGGIDLSVEPEYLPDASLADLEKAVESALAKPGAGSTFDVEYQGKQYKGMTVPLTKAGKNAGNGEGKPAKVQVGSNNALEFSYDKTGELSGASLIANAGWRAKAERVNGRSEVTFVDRLGHTFVRRYDPSSGFLSELTVDGRPYAVMSYDKDRRVAITKYEGFEEKVTYGGNGRIECYEVRPLRDDGRAAGQPRVLRFQYDGQGRMTRVSGDRQLSLAYRDGRLQAVESGRDRVQVTSDPKTGRPTKLETSWGLSLQLGYARGSLQTASMQYGGRSAEDSYENDRLTQTQGFFGEQSTYAYTAAGYLSSVTDGQGRTTRFAYDKDGQLLEVRLPDGGRLEYAYSKRREGTTAVRVVAHARP